MEKYPALRGMSEQKRIQIVKDIFSSITAKYDFLNRLLSLRRDVVWRRAAVKRMQFFHTNRMLDVATGTADLAIEAATRHRNVCVIGLDFVQEMINEGQEKVNRKKLSSRITLMNGDALELPFPENHFDVAGIAFGIRNIPDREKAMQEMKRTVVPGGQVMVLELTLPQNRTFQKVYRAYLYGILQRLARVFSRNPSAYFYLVDSITNFLTPDRCLKLMDESGLINLETIPLTFGITHLFIGYKPSGETGRKDNPRESVRTIARAMAQNVDSSRMERESVLLEAIEQRHIELDGVSTLEEGVERLIGALESVDIVLDDLVLREQFESQVVRIEADVHSVAPLTWVRTQKAPIRFYWSDPRDEVQLAGVGIGHQVSGADFGVVESLPMNRIVHEEKLTGLRYLGTGRFDAKLAADPEWSLFGINRFYLPLVELRRHKNRCTLACNLFIGQDIQSGFTDNVLHELRALNSALYESPPQPPFLTGASEEPDFSSWNGVLREILTRINGGHLEKVVAARAHTKFGPDPLDPMEIVALLAEQSPDTYLFCVQLDHHLGFLGASPEQLYERNCESIYSEALAGTRPRGKTPEEDEALANELVTSDKERREQAIVLDMILAKLEPFCSKIASDNKQSIRRLSSVQHLLTSIRGELRDGVSDAMLLDALHPTPAVCGYPTQQAMEEIRRLEHFDRGLFAGIVGLFGIDRTQVAIGIRSALIHGRKITVYAGAGVVLGSVSSSEWKETDYKMRPFADILGSRI